MPTKKLTAIFTAVIMTLTFSACGADIPISKLKFGMSEEQVKAAVKVAPYDEYSDDMFVAYRGSIDIFADLWVFSFYCDENGLYEIFLGGDDMPREECFVSRDMLMKKLSELYGVPESDWKIENDGWANFLNYQNEDGQLIQLYVRLWEGEKDDSACITLLMKSYDDISVIPKN
ncbi:MAG: hypothetical protein K2H90_08625 [Oscillospiraceae bacterium]|nr:hypothetical protein [Oscillospiraceae bacterium]